MPRHLGVCGIFPAQRGKKSSSVAHQLHDGSTPIHQQNTAPLLLDQVPRVGRVVPMARPRCNLQGFFWGTILQGHENHPPVRGTPQRKHEIAVRPLVAPPGGVVHPFHHRDLTHPTIFVTQDEFFALGMGCPSPDIAVKYPVSRHPLPDPPSRTPEEYEATGYRLVEDIPPGDLVDQLCAVHLEGDENWEEILLQGHNQGGGRQQTAPGTVNKWLPSEIKWRLLRILAHLFPVLDDVADREPRLMNGPFKVSRRPTD